MTTPEMLPATLPSYGSVHNSPRRSTSAQGFAIRSDVEDEGEYSMQSLKSHSQSLSSQLLENLSSCIAEFVGTFFISFTVACVDSERTKTHEYWGPLAVGASVIVMTYAVGPVSGAHLNPAVTLSLGFTRRIRTRNVVTHIIAQVGAGFLAGFLYRVIYSKWVEVHPAEGFHWWSAGAVELFFTMMVCLVYANCFSSLTNHPENDRNHFYGLAIGLMVVAGSYVSISISGGYLNPAVTLGLDLVNIGNGWWWSLVYVGFQVGGAACATALYRLVRPEDFSDVPEKVLESYVPELYVKCICEFIGTFTIVFTYGLTLILKPVINPLAAGAAVMSLVYCFRGISGGHFNPAITFAVFLCGRNFCNYLTATLYVLTQVTAGILAGMAYSCFYIYDGSSIKHTAQMTLQPQPGFNWWSASAAEIVFTALVSFILLAVTTTTPPPSVTKQNFHFGLSVGACVVVGGVAIGVISGGTLNPAVSFGVSVANVLAEDHGAPWWYCFLYALVEFAGGLIAAVMFYVTHPGEYFFRPLLVDE